MAQRKSGKDLRAEHQDLMTKTKALRRRINRRAVELIAKYPDVPYIESTLTNGMHLTVGEYLRYYRLTPMICLAIIEKVEQWLADQHPHKQTSIEFPEA